MAFTLVNNAEGGTNGTTVTTGNSGGASGNAFDVVNSTGTGQSLTYDAQSASGGALSYKWASGSASSTADLEWTTSIPSAVAQVWFRCYLFFTATPAANIRLFTVRGSAANRASCLLTTTGAVRLNNSAGSQLVISSSTIPTSSWARIEGFVIGSATVGQVELKTFLSPDSAVASDTQTSTAAQNTGGTIDQWWWLDHAGSTTTTYWIDGLGATDQGYLGPAATAAMPNLQTLVTKQARVRASYW